eukprot:TRINITY_DN6847_c0_g1_i1.p1 TRINITY_DN6847_c0_g1~~TRINITY_DN6847_c0_g1_i1.p1  ORF type:complete len:265 (+),score=50.76 TRINITY_DN6847_c0_g1_i1:66-860(+)
MNVLLDDLQRLADLHQKGLLSACEFKASKALVLGYASIRLAVAAKQATRRAEQPAPQGLHSQSLSKSDGAALTSVYDGPSALTARAGASAFHSPGDAQWHESSNNEDVVELMKCGMDASEAQRLGQEAQRERQGLAPNSKGLGDAHDFVEAMMGSRTVESQAEGDEELMTALKTHLDQTLVSKGAIPSVQPVEDPPRAAAPPQQMAAAPQSAEQMIFAAMRESKAAQSALTQALSKSETDNDEISALLRKQAGLTNRRCVTPPL